ncbi:hypothetical protein, conserved [Leishmania tarentolae]|uniref:Paraflagellar rod component n=1 Tax=Leishmania tarentolae TaxID=5689 RepID=A0A640KN40_LEITA|nr:hypothetical protein, conserved [Leishmania tarentolae]
MPNLCVSCTFNPPTVTLLGSTIREDTVRAMEAQLPLATSTAVNPSKDPVKFIFHTNPDYWRMELNQHFCDELHKASMFLVMVQCLGDEGWRLVSSNCVTNKENDLETTKLFFTRA